METNKEHLQRLLQSDTWTEQDKVWLSGYFHQDDLSVLHEIAFSQYNDDLLNEAKDLSEDASVRLLSAIHKRITIVKEVRKISLWPRVAAAVAVFLVVAVGFWFYSADKSASLNSRDLVENDISAGKSRATLTLGNGKRIILSGKINGELAKESGISITKTADGKVIYKVMGTAANGKITYNTLSTAKGETYQIVLPDGTKVWLNAASRLTYPAGLNVDGVRKVKLEGEAYFEVAKLYVKNQTKSRIPFIVNSKGQDVTVLGTHFNIDSYADEKNTRTTLLEGAVKVSSFTGGNVVLRPGEQAELLSNEIKVMTVDTDEMVAWKDGYFKFVDEDMQSIMRKIARWYNVDIQYSGNIPNEVFSGRISRSKNISQVLRMIESANSVHFKVEGRRVTVIK